MLVQYLVSYVRISFLFCFPFLQELSQLLGMDGWIGQGGGGGHQPRGGRAREKK